MDNKNTIIKDVLEHPFASWFIISAITSGIAGIIRSLKGVESTPNVVISSGPKTE